MNAPYLVECKEGGRRVAVLAYNHPEGICFLDVGWSTTGANPFHILQGPFAKKETPSGTVYESRDGDTVQALTRQDPLWNNWSSWLDFLESPDGVGVDPQTAIDACIRNGAMLDPPL